jgi:type IV pilus assembly protein PilY1
VYFGTGQYFETADNNPANQPAPQSVYAIWDRDIVPTDPADDPALYPLPITRDRLLQQTIVEEQPPPPDFATVRVTSDEGPIRWIPDSTQIPQVHLGWYLDLVNPTPVSADPTAPLTTADVHRGERIVSSVVLRNRRILFSTLTPSQDICERGGSSWLMVLDANDGSRLDDSPFDLNGDSTFSEQDLLTNTIAGADLAASGVRMGAGIMAGLSAVAAVDSSGAISDFVLTNTSESGSEAEEVNLGEERFNRQSWRQPAQ